MSKSDGVQTAIRQAARGSPASLRMNELNAAVSVSDGSDDVFVEVSVRRDSERRKTCHIATAAAKGILKATDGNATPQDSSGDFTEQATDGEKTVVVVSDRIYRVAVEDEWRGLPDAKLSARVTAGIESV